MAAGSAWLAKQTNSTLISENGGVRTMLFVNIPDHLLDLRDLLLPGDEVLELCGNLGLTLAGHSSVSMRE